MQLRDKIRKTVETIVFLTASNSSLAESVLVNSPVPTDFVCLKQVVSAFSDQCFNLMKVGYFSADMYTEYIDVVSSFECSQ